jgi:hypothetical protein
MFPPKESYKSRMAWIAHRREHKRRLDSFARYHNGNAVVDPVERQALGLVPRNIEEKK